MGFFRYILNIKMGYVRTGVKFRQIIQDFICKNVLVFIRTQKSWIHKFCALFLKFLWLRLSIVSQGLFGIVNSCSLVSQFLHSDLFHLQRNGMIGHRGKNIFQNLQIHRLWFVGFL